MLISLIKHPNNVTYYVIDKIKMIFFDFLCFLFFYLDDYELGLRY